MRVYIFCNADHNAFNPKRGNTFIHNKFHSREPPYYFIQYKYIDYTIKKAMYLIDESGLAQYNALKEKGFYNNIIGTSTICSIFCDSIKLDEKKLTFTYYGRQRIERRTSILMRQLITAGSLRRVPRTENNPHGFIIFGWRTLVNKDLSESQKTNY